MTADPCFDGHAIDCNCRKCEYEREEITEEHEQALKDFNNGLLPEEVER